MRCLFCSSKEVRFLSNFPDEKVLWTETDRGMVHSGICEGRVVAKGWLVKKALFPRDLENQRKREKT